MSDEEASVASSPCIPLPLTVAEKDVEPGAADVCQQEFADKSEQGETAQQHSAEQDNSAWRDELSVRLNRYRARRKMRPPRYPSLRLQFDAIGPVSESVRSDGSSATHPMLEPRFEPMFEPMSDRALALDGVLPQSCEDIEPPLLEMPAEPAPTINIPSVGRSSAAHPRAKIIEFPKIGVDSFQPDPFIFEPPVPPPDQLAEPVIERPRILEVPEVEPPPPALGGITMEPAERREPEKRLGIDIPLQSASLARRILASLVDGLIVGAASSLFGYIFWKVAAVRPPMVQIIGLAVGISCAFWAAYQYLLLVYAGATPGLRAAGLDLVRFDGTPTSRSLRRWRVLASYLSAASLGLGYVWVFLDEDVLCWHDRTTHTYLAPRKRAAQDGASPIVATKPAGQ